MAGSDGALGFGKADLDAMGVACRNECGGGRGVLVANFDLGWARRCGSGDGKPVYVARGERSFHEFVATTDEDALGAGFGGDDVERLGRCNAQSATLAHGEVMRASVLAEDAAGSVHNLALSDG